MFGASSLEYLYNAVYIHYLANMLSSNAVVLKFDTSVCHGRYAIDPDLGPSTIK
jgi:hypothetical protein